MLLKFLIDAKKQTYANEKLSSSRKGSSDYEYTNDGMIYHDTYFGDVIFIGEKVVFNDNKNCPF